MKIKVLVTKENYVGWWVGILNGLAVIIDPTDGGVHTVYLDDFQVIDTDYLDTKIKREP